MTFDDTGRELQRNRRLFDGKPTEVAKLYGMYESTTFDRLSSPGVVN